MESKLILLIEDNPDDEELTLRALRDGKVANDITVVRDGAEALVYLLGARAGPLPQLILLDLRLPKVGGLEVLERLRADERTRWVPVVVLTSSSEEEDVVASYRLGANSYVRKPVEFQRFVDAVQQLGLYWLLLNSAPAAK
jgi:two-component system response regulator